MQILAPALRFGEVAKGEIGFPFSANVRSVANGSRGCRRKNSGRACILNGVPVSGRNNFHDRVSGGYAYYLGNLALNHAFERIAQFGAQGGGIDPTHGTTVGSSRIDGRLPSDGGKI